MLYIISTIDGHLIDTASTPEQAHARSWWRNDCCISAAAPGGM